MESRTGCDTSLSSPGKVGYLRTFTHINQKQRKDREASAPVPPAGRTLLQSNQYCVSCGHHFHFSLKEMLSLLGH